jgi:predicted enzyme related to lactoylglutathione lyase
MLTGIGTITVQVRNQDEALEFYTGKLGFETRADTPTGPGQRRLEVAPPGAASYEDAVSRIGQHKPMVLETDDIEKTCARLKARGVRIVDEPKKQPYVWWATFADQDGNIYGVHQ